MTKQQAVQLVMFYGPETVALFRPLIPLSDEEIEEALKRRPYVRDLYALPANLAMADDMQTVRGAEVFAQSLQEQQPSQPQPQPPSTPSVDTPQPTAPAQRVEQSAASQQGQPDVGAGDIVVGGTVFEFAGFGPPRTSGRGGRASTSSKESNPYEEISQLSSFLGGFGGSLAASASLAGQMESLQNDFAQIHDALMAQAGLLKDLQQKGVDVAASLQKIKDKAERFLELEVQTTEKLQNLLALRLVYEASAKDPIVRETSIDYALDVLAMSEAKTGLLTPIGDRVSYVRPGPREAQVNIENALLGVFLDNNASEVGQAEVEAQLHELATRYAKGKNKSPGQLLAEWRANPASAPEAVRRILESPAVGSVVMEDLSNIALENVRRKAPTTPIEKEILKNGLVYAADNVARQMAAVIDSIVQKPNSQDAPDKAAEVLSRIGNVVEVVNSLRRQRNQPPIFLNAEQAIAYMLSATGAYERTEVAEKTRQFLAIASRAKPVVGPPKLSELLKMPKRKVTAQDVKKAYDAHVQKNRDYWQRVVGEAVQNISAAFIGLPNASALRKAAYMRWRERSTNKVGLAAIDKLFGVQYRRALNPSASPRPAKSTSKSASSGRGVSSSTRPAL